MRKCLLGLCLLPVLAHAAYTYTFEEAAVPAGITADAGTLSVSSAHYKEGTQSLQWNVSGPGQLTITGFSSVNITTSNALILQLYFPRITMDTLEIEMLAGNTVKRTATVLCNYKGWREINRLYSEYASTAGFTMTALRLRLHPASAGERQLNMDAVQLNGAKDDTRVPGSMWLLEGNWFKVNTEPLDFYRNQPDIALTTPSAAELNDLNTVRQRVTTAPAYNPVQASTAKSWIDNHMSITRNNDGTVCGTVVNTSAAGLKADSLKPVLDRLVALAGGKINGNATYTEYFDLYLDHLLDQGLAEGCPIVYYSNSYTEPRNILSRLINILPACNEEQASEIVKLGKWVSQYYTMYYPDGKWQKNIVSDIVYLFLPYMKVFAAAHPSAPEAVRELKALKRYLDRNTTYTDGGYDMLKPDGTGFHHHNHYNNYMYAYRELADAVYDVRGTCFGISEDGYARFGKAVMAVYVMATPSTGDTRHYALTLCGRNPFGSGQDVFWSKKHWNKLIESGADYPQEQQALKGAYNDFYQVQQYDVPANTQDGFHAFNWSPIGVYRHGKWVATMHAPTTLFWGAEIYPNSNRFGLYQSYGALEITYQGSSLASSGYPTNQTGGGWDWNAMPGTTVVRFNNWKEMMPNKNTTQRFDQYTQTKNFSGAAGLGSYGVWAADFDAASKWGTASCFVPTNLIFHKSVFVCDTILVALGSGIDSYGDYSEDRNTVTNLFQTVVGQFGNIYVDGTALTLGSRQTLETGQAHWLLSSTGTGYYVPAGNDEIVVVYENQTAPKHTGEDATNPTTSLKAGKAYINHGAQPENKRYEFVAVPAQNSTTMAAWAAAAGQQKPYQVLSCTNAIHAVQYGNVTGYVFFKGIEQVNIGIVRSTTNQHLMIDSLDTATGAHSIVLCNPNLNPADKESASSWSASPTHTMLVLNGTFSLAEAVPGVSITTAEGMTTLEVEFENGLPIYLKLSDTEPFALERTDVCSQPEKVLVEGNMRIRTDNHEYTLLGTCVK